MLNEENENKTFTKDFYDENENSKTMSDYYVVRDDLNYYNPKKSFHNLEFLTHIITFLNSIYQCRRCKNVFDFNNRLHTYLENVYQIVRKRRLSKSFANDNSYNFDFIKASLSIIEVSLSIVKARFFVIEAYNITTTNAIKNSSILSKPFANDCFAIIIFLIDVSRKIDTKYAYWKYSYVKEKMTLS